MNKVHYINQNGRIACTQHGGYYLRSATRDETPQAVGTPLDGWTRFSDEAALGFVSDMNKEGYDLTLSTICEGCNA